MMVLSQEIKKKLNKNLKRIADFYGITTEAILRKSKKKPLPEAKALFLKYSLEHESIPASSITYFLGVTHPMANCYIKRVESPMDLASKYIDFIDFVNNKKLYSYIKNIENYELRLKLEYIHRVITKKFKTARFRSLIENDLKKIVIGINNKKKEEILLKIYSWFEDFVKDFNYNHKKMLNNFDQTGR